MFSLEDLPNHFETKEIMCNIPWEGGGRGEGDLL